VKKRYFKDPMVGLCKFKRNYLYIALEELNLEFSVDEVKQVTRLWFQGWSLTFISNMLKRDADELAVLILSLSERSKAFIKPRKRGIHTSPEIEMTPKQERWLTEFLTENKTGYPAFQDFTYVDFLWDERHVLRCDSLWKKGCSIDEISKILKRNKIDIALLILDRAKKGLIDSRRGGLFGGGKTNDIKTNRRASNRKESAAS
jgi:hypothetical protein